MTYAIRCNKLYWAPESKNYKAGWAYMDGKEQCADIFLTENRQEAKVLRNKLRRKYCGARIRLYDMSNSPKLGNLTFSKIKYKN